MGRILTVDLIGRSALVAAVSALAFIFAPVAAADPNSPSYVQGKQAITDQIQHYHVQLNANTDWNTYCEQVLESDLKRGAILQVDSTPDFIAGCTDQGRALIASR